MRDFVFIFAHDHFEFRLPEFRSVAALLGIDLEIVDGEAAFDRDSYLVVRLPDEATALRLARRSIFVKTVTDLWGSAESYEAVLAKLLEEKPAVMMETMQRHKTFRIIVDGHGHKIAQKRCVEVMEMLRPLPWGDLKVNIKNADFVLYINAIFGVPPVHTDPLRPRIVLLGKRLGETRRSELLTRFALTSRPLLGPTSMDNELSLIMANMAQAAPGKLFYDPFVGTGSVLVACSIYGAHTMGGDIDHRLIRNPELSPLLNFAHYKLAPWPVDLMRCDQKNPPLRPGVLFDSIVCDPPYGIRAGAKQFGRKEPIKKSVEELLGEHESYIPPTKPYDMDELMQDLLAFAADRVQVGGRLVFWMPEMNDCGIHHVTYHPVMPSHPRMKLIAKSAQVCSSKFTRYLVTFERTL